MFRLALASTFLMISTAAFAGESPKQAVKDLQCMVGNWQGSGTMALGKNKIPLKMTYRCESAAGGFGVQCEGVITGIPGMAEYRERDLFGVNAADGTVHWFSVTSGGEAHDHHGKLATNAFYGQYTGRRNGKKFVEKVTLAFDNENQFHGSSQAYENGKKAEGMTFEMVKSNGRRASR